MRTAFTSSLDGRPHWLTWSLFWRVIEEIWKSLNEESLLESPADVQSAELRQAMRKAAPDLSLLGYSGCFLETQNKRGAEYIKSLRTAWNSIFKEFFEEKD